MSHKIAIIRKRLFSGRVPENKLLLFGTFPKINSYCPGYNQRIKWGMGFEKNFKLDYEL